MSAEMDIARQMLAAALEIEPGAIADGVTLDNFEAWTSVGHMRLILALEERIGRPIGPEEAVATDSLAAIAGLLAKAAG